MSKNSEEEWKTAFLNARARTEKEARSEELPFIQSVYGKIFCCLLILEFIEKVDRKEMDQAGASRGLKEMSSLFSQLKPKLSPYAVEKWNNVFFSFVFVLGTQKVATVGHFIISEEAKTISTH